MSQQHNLPRDLHESGPTHLQVFFWCGPHTKVENRTHYQQFSLNNQTFNIGDCVYLFPEDDTQPHYLGRIRSAFIDESAVGQDPPPHNIEIKWFERRVNLEQATKGIVESEKEVFELEDTDVNPIGCISGKCHIFRARNYQEAQAAMIDHQVQHDWFFCRGYYLQTSNSFRSYTPAELGCADAPVASSIPASSASSGSDPKALPPGPQPAPAWLAGASPLPPMPQMSTPNPSIPVPMPSPAPIPMPMPMSMAPPAPILPPARPLVIQPLEQPLPPPAPPPAPSPSAPSASRPVDDKPDGNLPPSKRKATGRVCVECGATSTPQWREGPAGPKTLCNACGVRHVRSLQRASKGRGSAAKGPGAAAQQQQQQQAAGSPQTSGGRGKGKAAAEAAARAEPAKTPAGPSSRPVRQAAIAALNRTAAFARTGEFPEEEAGAPAAGAAARRGGAKPDPSAASNGFGEDAS